MTKSPQAETNQLARNAAAMDETFTEASRAVMDQGVAIPAFARGVSSEMLNYASHRMTAHAGHLQMLAGCRTMQEVMDQQMGFMRSSVADFAQGFSKLAQASGMQANGKTRDVAGEPARQAG